MFNEEPNKNSRSRIHAPLIAPAGYFNFSLFANWHFAEFSNMAITTLQELPQESYEIDSLLGHFQLLDQPFALTADPRFLFLSSVHGKALTELHLAVNERRGLVVLRGKMGTGKTTLARAILDQWRYQLEVAYIGGGTFSLEDILRRAMKEFGLEAPAELAAAEAMLRSFADRTAREGRTVILLIDEAQNLTGETFESLVQLTGLGSLSQPVVQLVLAGQPELSRLLRKSHRRRRIPGRFVETELQLLSPDESFRYIEHRLEVAGGVPELFYPEALRLIARKGRGLPRRLNILCHNSLSIAFREGKKQIDLADVHQALAQSELPSSQRLLRRAAILVGLLLLVAVILTFVAQS